MSNQTCPSYAGAGLCKFEHSQVCAHNRYNYVCIVKGDLSEAPKVKTALEKLEAKDKGFSRKMNGIGSL